MARFISPVDVTPTAAAAWQDVNLRPHIPNNATGVILHYYHPSMSGYVWGFRKNGSTDGRALTQYRGNFWVAVGVDINRIVELWIGNAAQKVYVVGYFTDDAVFFENAPVKSLADTDAWTDVDISGDTGSNTAIGAIFEIYGTSSSYTFGMRKNGSSDNRESGLSGHIGGIVGVDENEICEITISNVLTDHYLLGYITKYSIFLTNATDISTATTGSWTDLGTLPTGAIGGYIEVKSTSDYDSGLRKNGSVEDLYYDNIGASYGILECDSSYLIEAKIEYGTIDHYLVGYPQYIQNVKILPKNNLRPAPFSPGNAR
jgi:hypothetical protein